VSGRRTIAILVAGFTLLGMPGAALGVAWPDMADDLGRNLGDLGVLTLTTGAAYATMSLSSGSLSKRFPAGRLLVITAFFGAVGLLGYAIADTWVILVLSSIPIGIAGGSMDSLGNAFVAVDRGPREMGAIHAAFGFGAMIAPLMMTALFAVGLTWRLGFGALAAAQVLLGIALALIATVVRMPMEGRTDRARSSGSRSLLGMSVWTFFIYAGVEGSVGLWAFTLLTEGQGVDETVAGIGVAAHWGALFASRVLIGIAGDRVPINGVIRGSVVGLAAGLALLWWDPAVGVAIFGLVLAGFCSGPIFPLEVLETTPRFGAEFTPWAVGYQLAAATISIAVIPASIGLLVNRSGPLVIGATLTVLSLVVVVSTEVLRRMSPVRRSPAGASP
jgi:fucose permease